MSLSDFRHRPIWVNTSHYSQKQANYCFRPGAVTSIFLKLRLDSRSTASTEPSGFFVIICKLLAKTEPKMSRDKLAYRYFAAWNDNDVTELLRLFHPDASYYDAFWQERCSGKHLAKYLDSALELESRWYAPSGELIPIRNGMICRYVAFDGDDKEGLEPLYNGADIFTISGGLIMTVSDYYCDPTPADLIEIALLAEGQHGRASVVSDGLSGKSLGHIKQRLDALATDSTLTLDSSLTISMLADHVGCPVMHLFHVLDEFYNKPFLDFVDECRARRASKLMLDSTGGQIRLDTIVEKAGFETVGQLNESFQKTFDMSVYQYLQRFSKTTSR